jgi:thiamine biosynthesis lipoprotein ApbE
MLTKGKEMSVLTKGVFDLFIKERLEDKGYGVKGNHVDNYSDSESDFVITEEVIQLKGKKSIDLGGIGKGYLLDVLAEILKKRFNVHEFLINGGGDMYGTHQGGEAIVVYIQNPEDRNVLIGSFGIKNQSLCASSSYVRSWIHDDKVKNHFITKDQREIWAASFVVGDNATLTDMLATVFCINSHDKQVCESLASQTSVLYRAIQKDEASFGNLQFTPVV